MLALRGRASTVSRNMKEAVGKHGLVQREFSVEEDKKLVFESSRVGSPERGLDDCLGKRLDSKPLVDGYHLPAEWEPHERYGAMPDAVCYMPCFVP